MKRRRIAGVLFLSFIFNIFYALIVVGLMLFQVEIKTAMGIDPEVAAHFSIPTMYLLFCAMSLLMQLVLVLSFSNSMRFTQPTLWIEVVGSIMFGGVLRTLYHYIPDMEGRFAKFAGQVAMDSREVLNGLIKNFDWLFFLASMCFLLGAGMTICFKKFVRYFMRSRDN